MSIGPTTPHGYCTHAELSPVICSAALIARRLGERSIQGLHLLLALHGNESLEAGRVLKRYVDDFEAYKAAMELLSKPPSAEQSVFGIGGVNAFREAAAVAEHFGRTQVTAVDLAMALIQDEANIKLLVGEGMKPPEFTRLIEELNVVCRKPTGAGTIEVVRSAASEDAGGATVH